ncbi:MAG TPA: antibiotic biosynthesis monooxygenase family protein [Streptosporangiaceae bacterium]|jgi:heme-degrading monooxygenase HmoA|nr:antibiotic biosynthesis monooxygenase family protein [Streptosporangiaceae bacterium]
MPLLRPLDPAFPIDRQLATDATPVVLVNLVTLDKADEPRFLEAWQNDAAFMKRQPGFISTQLHRAIGDSSAYVNYAVWESTAHYRAAFTHPEFKASLAAYPSSVVAIPHLFQKVAVPGICVA